MSSNIFKKLFGGILSFAMIIGIFAGNIIPLAAEESTPSQSQFTEVSKYTHFEVNENRVDFFTDNEEVLRVSLYGDEIIRVNLEPNGEFLDNPVPNKESHKTNILDKTEEEFKAAGYVAPKVLEEDDLYIVSTKNYRLTINKKSSLMKLEDLSKGKLLWEETEPIKYSGKETVQTLKADEDEYFYGGGMQNGFFSHKGREIRIANTNNWVDGGVASPNPFYVSTKGYGVMRHTWKPGRYDFGSNNPSEVKTYHSEDRFDAFYFSGDDVVEVMDSFADLTGRVAFMPEYAYYLGHLNCYNRPFSNDPTDPENSDLMVDAVKVIDDHKERDMPLAFFLPNDGYGCGYGKEDTQEGNLENLKNFVDYAEENGLKVGLWTQSELYPKDINNPLPQERNIDKEVGEAGTVAVKTDVAWVGQGYSMALDASRQAYEGIEKNAKGNERAFVVSLDGWAGTQRYATIWSGDQYGGQWEYIRFHIPTYIGQGLSANPNMGSDMDGIFGGSPEVQTRDYQWKAFTPIMLAMDGWAGKANIKNPYNYGEPYASINRNYLKLKAQMLPYNYTLGYEGYKYTKPQVRAMFLEFPEEEYAYTQNVQYQYMWGENLLVAPIYSEEQHDSGVRNDIYLPDEDQVWIDYFTGEQFKGGGVINGFDAPEWKTPVFVKNGAIIPMTVENNSPLELTGEEDRIFDVYPAGKTEFSLYEDDGITQEYKEGQGAITKITSDGPVSGTGTATIEVEPSKGSYTGMVAERGTQFRVNVQEKPTALKAMIADKEVVLSEVNSLEEFEEQDNVYFYEEEPNLNKYSTEGENAADVKVTTTPRVLVKIASTDRTKNSVKLIVEGFNNTAKVEDPINTEAPKIPETFTAKEEDIKDQSIGLSWEKSETADSYEIKTDKVIIKDIKDLSYEIDLLTPDTEYTFQIRARNDFGVSEWSQELTVRTKLDRFRNVVEVQDIKSNHPEQGSEPLKNLIDGDEGTTWHTDWGSKGQGSPQILEFDLGLAYEIDKFEYLPRVDGGNGTFTNVDLEYSMDGITWKKAVENLSLDRDGAPKIIELGDGVSARFLKFVGNKTVGNFGSGREVRIYKKDKTEGQLVGDYSPNGVIDDGDLRFMSQYVGYRDTDNGWGYAGRADLNYNGLVDAYDMMYVTEKANGGKIIPSNKPISGTIALVPSKQDLKAGEEFRINVIGSDFVDINAFSLELMFDEAKYKMTNCVSGCDQVAAQTTELTKGMLNYSSVREPGSNPRIFVAMANAGEAERINGSGVIATIDMTAIVDTKFDLDYTHGIVVNSNYETKDAIATQVDLDTEFPEIVNTPQTVDGSAIKVSGDSHKFQPGYGLENLIDGNYETLAEMLWDIESNAGKLQEMPLEMIFDFDSAREFTEIRLFKRTFSNGIVKKANAKGYLNGELVKDFGDLESPKAEEIMTWNIEDITGQEKLMLDRIVVTGLENYNNNKTMLTIREIEFDAYRGAAVEDIVLGEHASKLSVGDSSAISATVAPSDALNTHFKVSVANKDSSSTEPVLELMRFKDKDDNHSFIVRAVNPGTAEVTVTSLDGGHERTFDIEVLDASELKELIELVEEYKEEDYRIDTYEALMTELESAKEVYKLLPSQEAVSQSIEKLNTAVEGLIEIQDTSVLEEAIAAAEAINEEDYTKQSYKELQKVLADAKLVVTNYESKEDIDSALELLQTAVDALVEVVSLESLEKLIVEAEEILTLEENYEEETIVVLKNALESAKDALNGSNEDIQSSIEELTEAIDGVVLKDEAVSKGKLLLVLQEARSIEEDLYTADSFTKLKSAIEKSELVLDDESVTLEAIETAIDELETAIEELVLRGDVTDLKKVIEAAKAKNEAQYTETSYAAMNEVLERAIAAVNNPSIVQSEVDELILELETAIDNLVELGDKNRLALEIAKAEEIKQGNYTDESYQALKDAIASAKKVLESTDLTDHDIDEAIKNLELAVNALTTKPLDEALIAKLESLIKEAKSYKSTDYTVESYEVLQKEIHTSEAMLEKIKTIAEITDQDVKDRIAALNKAINDLVPIAAKPDIKEALEELVKEYESITAEGYEEASFKAFEYALTYAKEILAKEDATVEEVQAAYDALAQAHNDLVKAGAKPTIPEDKDTSEGTTPETGVTNNYVTYIAMIAIGALLLLIVLRKKKRNNVEV